MTRRSRNRMFYVVVVGGIAIGCGRVSTLDPAPSDLDAETGDGGRKADSGDGSFFLGGDCGLPADAGAGDAEGGDEDVRVPHITVK